MLGPASRARRPSEAPAGADAPRWRLPRARRGGRAGGGSTRAASFSRAGARSAAGRRWRWCAARSRDATRGALRRRRGRARRWFAPSRTPRSPRGSPASTAWPSPEALAGAWAQHRRGVARGGDAGEGSRRCGARRVPWSSGPRASACGGRLRPEPPPWVSVVLVLAVIAWRRARARDGGGHPLRRGGRAPPAGSETEPSTAPETDAVLSHAVRPDARRGAWIRVVGARGGVLARVRGRRPAQCGIYINGGGPRRRSSLRSGAEARIATESAPVVLEQLITRAQGACGAGCGTRRWSRCSPRRAGGVAGSVAGITPSPREPRWQMRAAHRGKRWWAGARGPRGRGRRRGGFGVADALRRAAAAGGRGARRALGAVGRGLVLTGRRVADAPWVPYEDVRWRRRGATDSDLALWDCDLARRGW